MKKIILLLLVGLSFSSCVVLQEIKDLNYQKVINNLNQNKEELYVKSNKWMVTVFNNADNVIQFSDKESGTLTGKYLVEGTISYIGSTPIDNRVFAILTIEVKDNRAKIAIDINKGGRAADLVKIKEDINNLMNDFEKAIRENKEDW